MTDENKPIDPIEVLTEVDRATREAAELQKKVTDIRDAAKNKDTQKALKTWAIFTVLRRLLRF